MFTRDEETLDNIIPHQQWCWKDNWLKFKT